MAKSLKIKKTSAADLVCQKMKELVADGTWVADQKIPSEADLAENFGVNRLTVRIALQRLNALGVLETRVGEGTYVRTFDFDKHLTEIADFYVNDKVMDDALEFRGVIELAAAKLAIDRWHGEDLERVRACCEAFEQEVSRFYSLTDPIEKQQSFVQTVDIGLALQNEIVKLSGNALLSYAFSIAKDPIRKHMIRNAVTRIHDPRGNHSKVWVKAYWDVYEGLKARDRDATMGALKRVINIKDSAK
mgnify:FL=1